MMNTDRKLRVAVLFGGRSGEHEVSLMSARSVLSVLDSNRYDVIQIGITLDGDWLSGANALDACENGNMNSLERVIPPTEPSHQALCVTRSTKMGEKLETLS